MANNHKCPNEHRVVRDTSERYLQSNLAGFYIFCGDKLIADMTFDVAAFGRMEVDSLDTSILKQHNKRWLEREVDRLRRELGHIDRTEE